MSKPLPEAFEGTWRFRNEKEKDGWNYLHFSHGTRISQFFNIDGDSYDVGRMQVKQVDPQTIEFFPEDGSPGWQRNYRFDDGNLVIIEGEQEFPCSRPSEIPDWLETGIEESDAYFDEHEPSWGKSE